MATEIVKVKKPSRKKSHTFNFQLSLAQLLQNEDNTNNKEKENIKQKKRVLKIIMNPYSPISLYNGKAPTMKCALQQIIPKNLSFLLLDGKKFKYICSNFNQIYPRLNFCNKNIKNYNLRNPCEKSPEYEYEIVKYNPENIVNKNLLQPLIDVSGFVDDKTFNKMLTIYEHNQQYYIDNVIDYDYDVWQKEITNLEQWFIEIIEPIKKGKQYKYWFKRECEKYNGASFYCNELLKSDILPLNFRYLTFYHEKLN